MIKNVLKWILLLGQIVDISSETLCPEEVATNGNGTAIEWPEIKAKDELNFFAVSRPPCFDSNHELVLRRCLHKSWIPKDPPQCIDIQRKNKYCPEELVEVAVKNRFICLKVSKLQPWDERFCYGSDKTVFDLNNQERQAVVDYLKRTLNISQFWIPASRFGDSTFDPVVWRLPGEEWGEVLENGYNELCPEKCVSAEVISYYGINLVMTNCDEELRSVCIFEKDLVISSACPDNQAALSYKPDICYGILNRDQNSSGYRFDYLQNLYSDNIFQLVFKYLDIKKKKCLVKHPQEYSPAIVYNPSQRQLSIAANPNCQLNTTILVSKKSPQMFLTFNSLHNTLILTVYNRKYLWRQDKKDYGIKCFTTADYELIRSVKIKDLIWEDKIQAKSLFELKLYGDGPGYYWCESHTIFNFEKVTSVKIVATKKRKGHPFAFLFELPCNNENCYRITENMKNYGKTIEKILNDIKENQKYRKYFNQIVIHNVRIMKIESITPNDRMKLLCHATVSLKSSSIDNSSEESSEEDDDLLNEYGIRHDSEVRHTLKKYLQDLLKQYKFSSNSDIQVNSTEYCFPEPVGKSSTNLWITSKIGMLSTTTELCLMKNGLPITRKCIGDFNYGAIWEHFNSNIYCIKNIKENIITKDLYQIERSTLAKYEPNKVINDIKTIIDKTEKIIPADLFFMGKIMQTISNNILGVSKHNLTATNISANATVKSDTFIKLNSTEDIVDIYNYLMCMDQSVFKLSKSLNSTNILLEAFENIINEVSITNFVNNEANYSDTNTNQNASIFNNGTTNGVTFHISQKLMIFAIDPLIANISGVALFNTNTNTSDHLSFIDTKYRFIYSNESKLDILQEENIEIATFVPQSLIDHIDDITIPTNDTTIDQERPTLKIIIKFYHNDRLFQENKDVTDKKVFSKIVSVSIPGYEHDLPELLPIFVQTCISQDENDTINSYRYWNYSTWADDGLEIIEKSSVNDHFVMFGSSHLTPFAYLIGGTYNLSVSDDVVIITKIHEEALDIITLLGCSLSLIGIIGIIVTALIFQTWRKKPTSKVLLQLSAAIALQMILFCFVNTDVRTTRLLENKIYSSCIILGAVLHYSVLVQFSWMLIVAFLQYKRYVQIIGRSRPTRFFLKAFLFGWGIPLIPVIIVLIIDMDAYIPIENPDNSKICYPSGQALYLGVALPILLIITSNLITFVLIIYHIIRGPDVQGRQISDRKLALAQVRISILLFFLLGFTWIFGLLAAMRAGIVFSYLFCLTATLQGFIIFIYFIVLDPVTRKLWSNFLTSLFCSADKK